MAEVKVEIQELLADFFPLWHELEAKQQKHILEAASFSTMKKGDLLSSEGEECAGILILKKGVLRFFTLSEEGREITFQRLYQGELSILSAACVLPPINFNIWIEAVEDCFLVKIKPCAFAQVMKKSLPLQGETYRLATKSLAAMVVAMQRMLFTSFDKRLAYFLCEETQEQGGNILLMTHEQIAKYIGTAREVVTRMLNQFAEANYVSLTRGKVEILNREALQDIVQGKKAK